MSFAVGGGFEGEKEVTEQAEPEPQTLESKLKHVTDLETQGADCGGSVDRDSEGFCSSWLTKIRIV